MAEDIIMARHSKRNHQIRLYVDMLRMLVDVGKLYVVDVRFTQEKRCLLEDINCVLHWIAKPNNTKEFYAAFNKILDNKKSTPITFYICGQLGEDYSGINFAAVENATTYDIHAKLWFESRDQAIMVKLMYG